MASLPTRSRTHEHLVLVADLGCTACGTLAQSVHAVSKGRVTVRDISDRTLPSDVQAVLLDNLEPILYTEDSGSVTIWKGLRLRFHLARLLGPTPSAQILTTVLRAQPIARAHQDTTPDDDHAIMHGWAVTRRQFLRTGSALSLSAAVLGIIPARLAGASTPSLDNSPGTAGNVQSPELLNNILAGSAVRTALAAGHQLDVANVYYQGLSASKKNIFLIPILNHPSPSSAALIVSTVKYGPRGCGDRDSTAL